MSAEGSMAFPRRHPCRQGLHRHVPCASDTFHSLLAIGLDPYIQMLGGEFIRHGSAQQKSRIDVVDLDFPSARGFVHLLRGSWKSGTRLELQDDLHVIMVQNTDGQGQRHPRRTRRTPSADRPNFPSRPGPGCTARDASSAPRLAIVKTSGKTRSTRASWSKRTQLGNRQGRG